MANNNMHIANFNNIVSRCLSSQTILLMTLSIIYECSFFFFYYFLLNYSRISKKKERMTTYLRIIPILHLIVEHVEIRFGQWFFLAFGNRCYMRIIRFLRVPQSEEVAGLHQRRHKLGVAQRLDAGVLRVHRMLHCPLPIGVFIHHLVQLNDDSIKRYEEKNILRA